jgi:serine/threonine protein kinase
MIAYAIYCCHKNDITHNDINFFNITVNKDLIPCLINFDWAHFGDCEPKRRCGLRGFIAPEINNETIDINTIDLKCSDVWSFGALINLAVYRRLPYQFNTDWSNIEELIDENGNLKDL